jgi:hypothetical protein
VLLSRLKRNFKVDGSLYEVAKPLAVKLFDTRAGRVIVRKIFIIGLAAASLGLSSCGVTASLDQAVSSLGSSPDLQLHFSATASGTGSAQAQKILNVVSLDVRYSNPSGGPLSQSNGAASTELVVNVGSQTLADIRVINSNAYLLVNVATVASIPGVNLSQSELSAAELIFGGHWYEVPESLINASLPTSTKVTAEASKQLAAEKKILDEISSVIETTKYATLPDGGYTQTGTLESIVKAVLPTINSLTSTPIQSNSVKGTYTLTVTTSGSAATGGSITITAPSGTSGNQSVGLSVTVAHANVGISVPTGATVITPALLKGLESEAS